MTLSLPISNRLNNRLRLTNPMGCALLLCLVVSQSAFAQNTIDAEQPAKINKVTEAELDSPQPDSSVESPNVLAGGKPADEIDLLYLRNDDGRLVLVPDMSFEDFSRLYKLDKRYITVEKQPDYEFSQLRMLGKVEGRIGSLQAELTVRQLRNGTIRVPLQLHEAVLADDQNLRDQVEAIQFEARQPAAHSAGNVSQDGYVVWLKGGEGTTHQLNIRFDVPVSLSAKESSITLTMPAAVRSSIELDVPGSSLSATSNDETRAINVQAKQGRSLISSAGLNGTATIGWTPLVSTPNRTQRVVLEARGDHRVRVRGPGLAVTDSRFRFFGRGGRLESVKLRLPVGARLVSSPKNAEYTLLASPLSIDDVRRANRQTVNIWFQEPDDRPREVSFQTEHTVDADDARQPLPLEVAGFEIVDAVRHYGRVSLFSSEAWLLRWEETANVRRVAHDVAADGAEIVAAFEYFRQRAKLPISVRRKATRAYASTSVDLSVLSREINMEATIDLHVSGAPTSFARINLSGWEIIDVESNGPIVMDELRADENEPLVLPFRQPFTGDVTVKVVARQESSKTLDDGGLHSIRLPSVQSAINGPVNLHVLSQPNLVVTPSGPANETAPDVAGNRSTVSAPSLVNGEARWKNAPRAYTFRGDPAVDLWNFSVTSKPQSVVGRMRGTVRIDQQVARITLSVDAQILHEPSESLCFEFRESIPQDVTIRIDGQTLEPKYHSWVSDDETATLTVQLPQPMLGNCQLEIEYETAVESTGERTARSASVPLPRATIGEFEYEDVAVQVGARDAAAIVDESWNVDASNPQRLLVSNSMWTSKLPISIQRRPGKFNAKQVVERFFWQTWLTSNQRQDRVVFAITTDDLHADLELPEGIYREGVKVLVNQQPIAPLEFDGNRLRIDLGESAPTDAGQSAVIELSLPFVRRKNEVVSTPPKLNAHWNRKMYWQVVLPQNEFCIQPPEAVDSEDEWSAYDVLFGHRSNIPQAWLEEWSGGSQQVGPPEAVNTYVFSTFGDVPALRFQTARRRELMFLVALVVFGLGILPSRIESLQRPGYVIAVSVVILISTLLFPMPLFLVAPAIVLGICMIVISRSLLWWKQVRAYRSRFNRSDSSRFKPGHSVQEARSAQTAISSLPPLHVSAPDS